jgi:hypothetical protein
VEEARVPIEGKFPTWVPSTQATQHVGKQDMERLSVRQYQHSHADMFSSQQELRVGER